MYLMQSIIDGLKILGFEKETIKKVSKEVTLEDIFVNTLFLNYLLVLIVFLITIGLKNGIQIGGNDLNMPIFWGLLMIYPFVYNLVVYIVYGIFGFIAELLDSRKKVKPLVSVGFHAAIVYSVIFLIIGIASIFNPNYAVFLIIAFIIYFILIMFLVINIIYHFSTMQTLIVLCLSMLIMSIILLIMLVFMPLEVIMGSLL